MKMMKMMIAALSALGFVACSTEEPVVTPVQERSFSLIASQLQDTRVTITDHNADGVPTHLAWEAGDEIAVVSSLGTQGTLAAETSGATDVKFEGTMEGLSEEAQNYYAVYPKTAIADDKTVTFDYTTQSGGLGRDAVCLVGRTSSAAFQGDVVMDFKPINTLLYVTLGGKEENLQSVVLRDINGAEFYTKFTYDLAGATIKSREKGTSITVTDVDPKGFYIALPSNVYFENGYILTFTDANGSVIEKAYSGKELDGGQTYYVHVDEWVAPGLTIAPMTSYSYYLEGGDYITTANACDNGTIYFSGSISNLQKAMISKVEVVVGETRHEATLGSKSEDEDGDVYFPVTLEIKDQAWATHTVTMQVTTKTGRVLTSGSTDVYITGLPFRSTPPTEAGGWTTGSWNNKFQDDCVKIGGVSGSGEASCSSPSFYLPSETKISLWADCRLRTYRLGIYYTTDFTVKIGSQTLVSQNSGKDHGSDEWQKQFSATGTISNGQKIKCQSSYEAAGPYVKIYSIELEYR